MLKGTEGFTIIEVTLFLAISGMLLLMMFIGTGTMASRQRFTDTVDSLQVFFQSQYDEVVHGVNVRNTGLACASDSIPSTPGKSNCLLIGKLLYVNGTTIQASYVISTQSPTDNTNNRTKLQTSGLEVVTVGQTTYEVKWGASIFSMNRSDNIPVNSIAFLRVPDSNSIVQLIFQGPGASGAMIDTSPAFYPAAYNPSGSEATPSLAVCIENTADFPVGGPKAAVRFSQGLGAGIMTTDYNPGGICP